MFGNSARHPRALEFAEVDAAWAVAEGLSGVRSAAAGGRHQRYASHPGLDAKIEMHNLLHCKWRARWEFNLNVWFPFIYSQKWNCYFPKQNYNVLSPAVPTLIYLWGIYIFPGSVCLFCCREICGPILGIYKLLTDTWMWKLGPRPRNTGIHKWDFPCSVLWKPCNRNEYVHCKKRLYFFPSLSQDATNQPNSPWPEII